DPTGRRLRTRLPVPIAGCNDPGAPLEPYPIFCMGAGPLQEQCAYPCGGSEQMAEGTLSCGPLLFTHKSGPLGFLDRPDRRDVPGGVSLLTQEGARSYCQCP